MSVFRIRSFVKRHMPVFRRGLLSVPISVPSVGLTARVWLCGNQLTTFLFHRSELACNCTRLQHALSRTLTFLVLDRVSAASPASLPISKLSGRPQSPCSGRATVDVGHDKGDRSDDYDVKVDTSEKNENHCAKSCALRNLTCPFPISTSRPVPSRSR